MTMLIISCVVLTTVILTFLVRPLIQTAASTSPNRQSEKVYKVQLQELERDIARGLIAPDEAKIARAEIGRRLIAAHKLSTETQTSSRPALLGAFALLALVPITAGALYLQLGSPEKPAAPFATRPVAVLPSPDRIAQIAARLETQPEDAAGWALLAQELVHTNRVQEALPAYAQAHKLTNGQDLQLSGNYAETIVVATGTVTEEARVIFEQVLEKQPEAPQASFYLALYLAQQGKTAEALNAFKALRRKSPEGAPWISDLDRQIEALEEN